ILMSPSAALHAAIQEEHNVAKANAISPAEPTARCTRRFVPSVGKKPKYRSSHAKTDLYIVAHATLKSD
ncbi:MAG: hypothetical protein PHN78_07490, partial [Dehalococcoidales bacterium]|nr:hypothetical protein [Dehalococcoidales bacterium]